MNKRDLENNNPFFTVITVVRNGDKTLQQCIDSIKSQSFRNFEYLVIDGGSSDSTIKIINSNSEIIDYCISERDDGIYSAMNKGLQISRGKFIGILNSDDFYQPDTLKKVREIILKDPDTSIIYGAMRYLSNLRFEHFIHFQELDKKMIFHPTCFVSREVYRRVGNFNTRYRIAADYEFMMRCRKLNEKFTGISEVLANFSEGGASSRHKLLSIFETAIIQLKYSNTSIYKIIANTFYVLVAVYLKPILLKLHILKIDSRRNIENF